MEPLLVMTGTVYQNLRTPNRTMDIRVDLPGMMYCEPKELVRFWVRARPPMEQSGVFWSRVYGVLVGETT